MSTEGDLYRDNVPHGVVVLAYDNWTNASKATITATASASKVMYVSSVDFIIDDGASISGDSITIADSGTNLTDIVIDDLNKLVVLSDKQTLQFTKIDATNEAIVGELRFHPPVQVVAAATFTITPGASLVITDGAVGIYFAIRGWEDDEANA